MRSRIGTALGTFAICAVGATFFAAQQPAPTFRSATRLVEVPVVVTDREGNPVTGLTKEDFRIEEDRIEQAISIFRVNDLRAATPVARPLILPPQFTFTNARNPSAASTVLLLDRLNAAFDSQWFARRHVERYLDAAAPGDRFAIYVLDGSIRVLHDFTEDRAALRRALDRYTTHVSGHYDASNTPETESPGAGIAVWLADPTANVAEFFSERRSHDTLDGFRYLSSHLSGVSGRKAVVWISEAFAIPSRFGRQEFLARLRAATRAMNDAQIALYPVDARGLIAAQSSVGGRVKPTTLGMVMGNVDTMKIMAEQTGGRAFYNTNALDDAIRRSVDDGRHTYVLGYYPANPKWDGAYRAIEVEVKRKGVTARFRHGYLAAAPAPDTRGRDAALREALQAPLQATQIGIAAAIQRTSGGVEVSLRIDPATLTLTREGTSWQGTVDLLMADVSPKGLATIVSSATLDLKLTDEGRRQAMADGLPVTRTVKLAPDSLQLRVLVRDVPTGAVGSIVIPASQLR